MYGTKKIMPRKKKAELRKDGMPKESGGFRIESSLKNRNFKNLGSTILYRIPENRLEAIKYFLALLEGFPDRCPILYSNSNSNSYSYSNIALNNPLIIKILEEALTLPANKGGAIKIKIKDVLKLLK